MILAGWMARDLGGRRGAQIMAALAMAIAPVSVLGGELFEYFPFDYLWWVAIAWMTIRLLKSGDARWFIGIGAVGGLGMMTRYTMGVCAVALTAGLLLTPARRFLKSGWLWAGLGVALAIWTPNIIWQVQHHFISVDFLQSIHKRDVRIGRASGFVLNQLWLTASPLTIPLWAAGLWYYFSSAGRPFRVLGWMFLATFAVLLVTKGRDYYMSPVYPMLLAAGAVWMEPRLLARRIQWGAVACGGVLAVLVLPIVPVNSALWNKVETHIDDFHEEIGWPELVNEVAAVRDAIPAEQRAGLAILAANYGEAGAIDLYGPAHGLPSAISGVNSYWLRGYGDPPPRTLIVLGLSRRYLDRNFDACAVAGHVMNRLGVLNEETRDHPDIFVCSGPKKPWPEFWKDFQYFG